MNDNTIQSNKSKWDLERDRGKSELNNNKNNNKSNFEYNSLG